MHALLMAIDWALIIEKLVLISFIIMVSLLVAMYETYAERKVAAIIQDRRVQTGDHLASYSQWRMRWNYSKGRYYPPSSNRLLFILGPGDQPCYGHDDQRLCLEQQIWLAAEPFPPDCWDIGILIFSVVSMGVYGVMIGGWASNNKFSLLAAIRGASQIISYELAMGLSLIALLMLTGSLSLKTIVEQQQDSTYYFFYQPIGFLIFLICAFAECNRTPFDLFHA
jgi:NADH-quinone oxidoreductase subunit H